MSEPSETILLMEESRRSVTGSLFSGGLNDGCFYPDAGNDLVADRHGKGGEFLFPDGHVKWHHAADVNAVGARLHYMFYVDKAKREAAKSLMGGQPSGVAP